MRISFWHFSHLVNVNPATNQGHDYIVNVWVKNGFLYAGSFAGYDLKVNTENGEILETKFTK